MEIHKHNYSYQNENNSILSAAGGGCSCRLPCVESDSQGDPGEGGTPLQDHPHHEQMVWGESDYPLPW